MQELSSESVLTPPAEARLELEATFENFDCQTMVVTVKTKESRLVRLFLHQPDRLEVKGTGAYTVDLACGAQKHQPLRVAFLPQEDLKRRTVGLLRTLEFLKGY
jgi:hypothetical protein